jgi:phosphohistidine phosphatase
MELYLVQHGASKSEAEDPQRGLTEEGKRTVEPMGEYLAALGLALDRIEHSDKLRARQTAEILAAKLHPANGTVQVPGLTPNDDVEPIRVRLNEETKNIMLVGHLPHLSRLVSRLIGLERDHTLVRFQMGGVVKLEREDGGCWVLCWIFTPELLPGQGQ